MEIKDTGAFHNYQFADIREEDLKNIAELEKTISSRTQDDIVLIAYKHSAIASLE